MVDFSRRRRSCVSAGSRRQVWCRPRATHPFSSLPQPTVEIIGWSPTGAINESPIVGTDEHGIGFTVRQGACILYTFEAADELTRFDLGGSRLPQYNKDISLTDSFANNIVHYFSPI